MQLRQKLANFAVFCARHFFDRITSYNLESMNERKWLRRILFLETVAGRAFVPSWGVWGGGFPHGGHRRGGGGGCWARGEGGGGGGGLVGHVCQKLVGVLLLLCLFVHKHRPAYTLK